MDETKSNGPVMDVMRPKAEPGQPKSEHPHHKATPDADKKASVAKTTQHTMPKEPKNGVMLAIVATVIIVFGLAAMAVYAYKNQ